MTKARTTEDPRPRTGVAYFDWKETPEFEALEEALGKIGVSVYQRESQDDGNWFLFSTVPLTDEQVDRSLEEAGALLAEESPEEEDDVEEEP